jgi:hypothetical protein
MNSPGFVNPTFYYAYCVNKSQQDLSSPCSHESSPQPNTLVLKKLFKWSILTHSSHLRVHLGLPSGSVFQAFRQYIFCISHSMRAKCSTHLSLLHNSARIMYLHMNNLRKSYCFKIHYSHYVLNETVSSIQMPGQWKLVFIRFSTYVETETGIMNVISSCFFFLSLRIFVFMTTLKRNNSIVSCQYRTQRYRHRNLCKVKTEIEM